MIDVERLYLESAEQLRRCVRARFSRTSVPDAVIEDACAQAWLIAWRHRERIEPDSPIGWLIVVAVNEVLALLRKRRGEACAELSESDGTSLIGDIDRALEFQDLVTALAGLKPQQQTTLLLKAAGFRYDEIERITGRTYTWVNRHISEGRRALREVNA